MSWLKGMTNEELLHCLQEDFELLKQGSWIPDEDSCEASLDVVAELLERERVES